MLSSQFILGIILTITPLVELRAGLPVALHYAITNNISTLLVFSIVVLLNISLIFAVFFFLDFLNKYLLKISIWKKSFEFWVEKTRCNAGKVSKNMEFWGFWALAFFVAIPLPLTGVYTGCMIAWILGLNRKKSIISISIGTLIAGIIVYLITLGVFGSINFLQI